MIHPLGKWRFVFKCSELLNTKQLISFDFTITLNIYLELKKIISVESKVLIQKSLSIGKG